MALQPTFDELSFQEKRQLLRVLAFRTLHLTIGLIWLSPGRALPSVVMTILRAFCAPPQRPLYP